MFGIGTPELVGILILVLLVYGPDRLPAMARKIGELTRDLKRIGDGVRQTMQSEIKKIEQIEKLKPTDEEQETKRVDKESSAQVKSQNGKSKKSS